MRWSWEGLSNGVEEASEQKQQAEARERVEEQGSHNLRAVGGMMQEALPEEESGEATRHAADIHGSWIPAVL